MKFLDAHMLWWAAAFAGAALPALILQLRRRAPTLPLVLRVIGGMLLAAALAGPYLETIRDHSSALVLLDVSDSMDEGAAQKLLERAAGMDGIEMRLVPFAKTSASSTLPLDRGANYHGLKQAWSKLDIGATNLSSALSAASAESAAYGEGGSTVLLVSDGNETEGDFHAQVAQAQASGAHIFPLVPEGAAAEAQHFKISQLHVPLVAPAQKSVEVSVGLLNSTGRPQRGVLEIKHDRKTIYRERIEVPAGAAGGGEQLISAQSDPSQEGIREITATLTPEETGLPPSTEVAYLSGEQRERVLVISGSAEDAPYLEEVLKGQSYQIRSVVAQGSLTDVPNFSDFSVVIFNNIARGQFPPLTDERLATWVRGGGAFVMIGGDRSFGLGGYAHTAIDDILPVQCLPPQTMEKRLNLALEMVIDKSSSMAFDNRLEYAKEAARETVRTLKDDDFIGVIGFDSVPMVFLRLDQVAKVRDRAVERIGRMVPAQKTSLKPAMDEARRDLERAQAGRKHMIILTDGKLPDSGPWYLEEVRELRMLGITVSTVLIGGEGDDGLLKQMADLGGGAYYETADLRAIPKIFLSDVKATSGERTIKEQSEYLVRRGPAQPRLSTMNAFPPLRGYVQTKARSGADTELVTYANDKAEPLLASWHVGKGQAVAFTSDANARWSNAWARWNRFAQFWTEMIDAIRPEHSKVSQTRFDLRYVVEHGALNLDVSVFAEDASGALDGVLVLPDGTSRPLSFTSAAAGRFSAELDHASAGRYEARLHYRGDKLTPVAFFLSGELFGEKRGQGYALPVLEQISSATGGKVNPSVEELRRRLTHESQRTDLSYIFAALAAAALLIEVIARELRGRPIALRARRRGPGILRRLAELRS